MKVGFDRLVREITECAGKRTMLTFHSIGDTDSISSAFALREVLPNASMHSPDRLTSNAVRLLKKLGFEEKDVKGGFLKEAEAVILLDVNNFDGCGEFAGKLRAFKGKIIVIDHHLLNEDLGNAIEFSDESYNSTASIAYDILKEVHAAVDAKLAKLLVMGILSDSAEFKNTTPETFAQLGELLGIAKTDYISLITETGHISPAEEREKTIADVMNARIMVKEGLLFLYGRCHAHANLAADSAIRIGADVSLFYSLGREVSFSARLRPTLDRRYGIHLGRIMDRLASLIDGTGGGHPCAAGAYGSRDNAMEFTERFLETILERASR